jgi:hypothetical protein
MSALLVSGLPEHQDERPRIQANRWMQRSDKLTLHPLGRENPDVGIYLAWSYDTNAHIADAFELPCAAEP